MNSFSSLTIWIVLATIIPGFFTIACVLIVIYWVFPNFAVEIAQFNNVYGYSIAIATMLITQSIGIILEKMLGSGFLKKIKVKNMANSRNQEKLISEAYTYYQDMYFIISRFTGDDDKHGHIQRIIGQFFLSLNTLASYCLGIITMIIIVFFNKEAIAIDRIVIYSISMLLLSLISLYVIRIRYCSMIQSLWSIENKRKNS